MKTTLNEKKIQAIEELKKLKIYKPYINEFKENDTICFFEKYGGFWAYQDEELMKKVKQIEEKYNCLVYAITHEYTCFGELYDFLIITDYKEEWSSLVEQVNITDYFAYAYVWNKTDDFCSEFGTISLRSLAGGIARLN